MPGILILDELQSATEGGGIKLKDPLQTQDGTPLLSPSGEVSINFDNLANNTIHMNKLNIPDDAMSGDKIHGGTISGSFLDGIKLNSSGNSITKSDGITSVLSESGGNITLNANEIDINRISTDGTVIYLRKDGTTVGSISVASAGTTYNTTSDRRLKDNIKTITNGTDKLMAMNPVTHTWKANPETNAIHGFIAQEMQKVIPEAVSGDAESDEMMSMDYGRITPVIVAALQDALNEIEELKMRINKLEKK